MAYHISNGEISTGIFLNDNRMYISNGGVANSTTIDDDGEMYIYNGGVANNTDNYGGEGINVYASDDDEEEYYPF